MHQINSRRELPKLISELGLPKKAVEVGVAEGRLSQEFIECGLEKLYLVDLFEHCPFLSGCASFDDGWHEENYRRVKELFKDDKRVKILKGFSHKVANEVPNNSLGLVYIDAAHDYQSVKSDIQIWKDKLVKGGVMAFHDYANEAYGVKRAVIEFISEANINIIPEDGSIENIGAWIKL